jgi:AcrR family transcriptional regulator
MSPAQVRPLRKDAAQTRLRLIAAAEAVFAEQGPSATMEQVADRAAVGAATLYRRFPTKPDLMRAVLSAFFIRLIAQAELARERPGAECLEAYLLTVGHELAAHRGLVQGDWGDALPAELFHQLRALTGELIAKAQAAGAVSAGVTIGDVAATVWALRGILQTSAEVTPEAWRRHVSYVLAGFRMPAEIVTAPISVAEIDQVLRHDPTRDPTVSPIGANRLSIERSQP